MEDEGQRGLGGGNGKAAFMTGEECLRENKTNVLGVLPLGSVYDIEAWFMTKRKTLYNWIRIQERCETRALKDNSAYSTYFIGNNGDDTSPDGKYIGQSAIWRLLTLSYQEPVFVFPH